MQGTVIFTCMHTIIDPDMQNGQIWKRKFTTVYNSQFLMDAHGNYFIGSWTCCLHISVLGSFIKHGEKIEVKSSLKSFENCIHFSQVASSTLNEPITSKFNIPHPMHQSLRHCVFLRPKVKGGLYADDEDDSRDISI